MNMIKETVTEKKKITKLSIVNNKISSVLKADDVKTGLRLYSDSCIGIAGAIGDYDENELYNRARNMLKYKIPYEPKPSADNVRTLDLTDKFTLGDDKFIRISEEFLEILKEKYPDFSYSNVIRFTETETSIKNDNGTDLLFKDKHIALELIMKHKNSANLMDGMGFNLTRMYSVDECLKAASETCEAYIEKIDLPIESEMPVVFLYDFPVMTKFITDLNGESFGTGTSLFSGKLGDKIFSDDFSMNIDRNPLNKYECFFDGEGTTLENDCFPLIENGILRSPYSSKKIAERYNLPITASASLNYDSVPDTAYEGINVKESNNTIKELLGGRKAVYVIDASGGDFTPQGEFASPVQIAYLFDGEKLLGRLPQLSINSNIFDMFGKDYIGVSKNGYTNNQPFKYFALNMKVKKIGGHI